MKRKVIEIDRSLCNGCGECTTACAEGALAIDAEGKAVLVHDIYCDGLGACLNVCPTGALQIIEREAEAFDEAAVSLRTGVPVHAHAAHHAHGPSQGCPGSRARTLTPAAPAARPQASPASTPSELGQWPIQLHLVSPAAPYFHECDLLIAADCTAFALGSFHADLLRGKALVIACPKLDRTEGYFEKLADLIGGNTVYSVTVAIMEVPCCSGLSRIVAEAVARSGKNLAVKTVVVPIQ
jgi:NAD-dependent dihydropyrimidine dehydrogenase PreA subunit